MARSRGEPEILWFAHPISRYQEADKEIFIPETWLEEEIGKESQAKESQPESKGTIERKPVCLCLCVCQKKKKIEKEFEEEEEYRMLAKFWDLRITFYLPVNSHTDLLLFLPKKYIHWGTVTFHVDRKIRFFLLSMDFSCFRCTFVLTKCILEPNLLVAASDALLTN